MNGERIRQGLAGLCASALLLIAWLLMKPDHRPGLGESYTRWQIAGILEGITIIVGAISLGLLIVGLLKPRSD